MIRSITPYIVNILVYNQYCIGPIGTLMQTREFIPVTLVDSRSRNLWTRPDSSNANQVEGADLYESAKYFLIK